MAADGEASRLSPRRLRYNVETLSDKMRYMSELPPKAKPRLNETMIGHRPFDELASDYGGNNVAFSETQSESNRRNDPSE
jgi:hypothetical protein